MASSIFSSFSWACARLIVLSHSLDPVPVLYCWISFTASAQLFCMYSSLYAVSRGKTQGRLSLCIYNSSYAVSRDRTQDQLQVLFVDSVLRCRQGVLFLEVCYMSLSNGSDGGLSMKFIFSSNCNVWTLFFLNNAPLTASFGVHIHSTSRSWFRAKVQ